METFSSHLSARIRNIELSVAKTDDLIKELGSNFNKYVDKARETLKKKHVINPKPHKRLMRIISESDEDEIQVPRFAENPPIPAPRSNNAEPEIVQESSQQSENLRPVRTAKANASKNLKELPTGTKLRNDNNVAVFIKAERVSNAAPKKNRDSTKENPESNNQNQRVSSDEGIQMGSEPDIASENNVRRTKSVEIISVKPVEIDLSDDSTDKMPPPPIPVKKKKNQKQTSQELPADQTQPIQQRITRSKIKKEKASIERSASSKEIVTQKSAEEENHLLQKSTSDSVLQNQTKVNETVTSIAGSKKVVKKKYPMPILVKLERVSNEEATVSKNLPVQDEISENDVENIPPMESAEKEQQNFPINETVTISSNLPVNQTITLANNVNETYNKNQHDSLMTEDNDEDDNSMVIPPLKEKNTNVEPPLLPLKFKKNEVFNPYMSSPVKQKVQAFEKHAVHSAATPDKSKPANSKYSTLKSGTPSKIALFNSKTTPLNNAKQKYIAAISGSASSSTSSLSSKKTTKKYTSLSQDSNEDLRKIQAQSINHQLEEKRKQREEKQRQVQLQREAIEKQKREQTLQQQRERDEKFRKIMQEKEEAKRLEAMKKKIHKENQEKKYAEEKARKDESVMPKEPQSASKDDSLYIKMQKQIIKEKAMSQKKKQVDKNAYSFEMLNTDDSTDDESHPSKKRPEPPQWSKKQVRKKQIHTQSFANSGLLDTLFSTQPINVNLKEIFPTIDARKLIRNSSAVWNTPPRYSQIPKY